MIHHNDMRAMGYGYSDTGRPTPHRYVTLYSANTPTATYKPNREEANYSTISPQSRQNNSQTGASPLSLDFPIPSLAGSSPVPCS